jgi:hypothetical protein
MKSDNKAFLLAKAEYLKDGPFDVPSLEAWVKKWVNAPGVGSWRIRPVITRAMRRFPLAEARSLVALRRGSPCPNWLQDWHCELDNKTPDSHLELFLDRMRDSTRVMDWDLADAELRITVLKLARETLRREKVLKDKISLESAEKSVVNCQEEIAKLRARAKKRDASPTRK